MMLPHLRRNCAFWDLASQPGVVVDLRVRDDGVGLDPADSERLFTRFVGRGFGPSPPSLPTAEPERRF